MKNETQIKDEAAISSNGMLPEVKPCAWISLKDERPEIGIIVIVTLRHSKEDVYAGFRANGGWYCFRIGEDCKQYIPNGIKEAEITHWMPLPKSPCDGKV